MMELTPEHIAFIRKDIALRGITMPDLAESVLDHICCSIENGSAVDFTNAYAIAIESFGEGGIEMIQKETQFLISIKQELIMKKSMFVLAYLLLILTTTGLLFKVQHWPGASVMLVLGVVLMNFGFLPMYFYSRYRGAVTAAG